MVAWILNFDADDELASPRGAHTSSRAMLERMESLVPRLEGLIDRGDVVLRPGDRLPGGREDVGDAWCLTPSALERLRRGGARVPPAPTFEVLRKVNGRAFSAALGQTLLHAVYAASLEEVLEALASGSRAYGSWLLKRPFGFAGRGRRKVRASAVTPEDLAWIAASVREHGGLQAEPLVARNGDFAIHAHLAADGTLTLGDPTLQVCDDNGAWLSTAVAAKDDLARDERDALIEGARDVARALHDAAYFGPFGVDAYRWSDAAGVRRFNRRSEINARYSMGWGIGMRSVRTRLQT